MGRPRNCAAAAARRQVRPAQPPASSRPGRAEACPACPGSRRARGPASGRPRRRGPPRPPSGAGRFRGGGAGGHHVIDEEDGFAGRCAGCGQRRTRRARSRVGRRGFGRSAWAWRGCGAGRTPARQAQLRGEAMRQRLALVVAAQPAASPVQRHRNQHVRPERAQRRTGVVGPELAEQLRQRFRRSGFSSAAPPRAAGRRRGRDGRRRRRETPRRGSGRSGRRSPRTARPRRRSGDMPESDRRGKRRDRRSQNGAAAGGVRPQK